MRSGCDRVNKESLSFLYTTQIARARRRKQRSLVKLKGVPASVLSKLLERGYYSTKSEALRAGVVRLGQEFGLVNPTEEAWMRLQSEMGRTRKRVTAREVIKELERLYTQA